MLVAKDTRAGTPEADVESVRADVPLTVSREPADEHREQYSVLADHVEDVGITIIQKNPGLATPLYDDQLSELIGSEGALPRFLPLLAQVFRDNFAVIHVARQIDVVDAFDAALGNRLLVRWQGALCEFRPDIQAVTGDEILRRIKCLLLGCLVHGHLLMIRPNLKGLRF